MKQFLKHIVYFSITLLAILTVVDGIVTYLYHQKNTRKYAVWNDILHRDINADLLIMGNSRAWGQYSTYILDSVLLLNTYNIGMDGSCFNRQSIRYDIYRHYQRRKPDYIIQNVEFFTLEYTIGYEHEQFSPYMMYPYFRKKIREVEPFTFDELYIPMVRYYKHAVYDDYFKFDYVLHKGFYTEDEDWDGSRLSNVQPYNAVIDSTSLCMFKDYIKKTRDEGIQLILVMAPIYKESTNKVLNLQEIHDLYDSLAQEYNLYFLDYSDIEIANDTTYFHNATHLNKLGTEIFSLRLANDVKRIIYNK